ncbi:MAG: hypothetical protein KGN84_05925, partial [Acidobacteriota bacterium]|nr:hypothetical protein [Acidobacteriota bacterium]
PPEFLPIAGSAFERDDKDVVALQAADLLAGSIGLMLEEEHTNRWAERLVTEGHVYHTRAYPSDPDKVRDMLREGETLLVLVKEQKKRNRTTNKP